jgi:Calpain family cysteine protease
VVKALQFVDRMIQSATRVETLHQGVNGYANPAGYIAYPTYIKYAGFLRELTELGFEIARVNPTTTVGVNEMSNWVENLLEFGGSATGIQLAAGGLSQLFNGFTLNKSGGSVGMAQLGKALDYMGRLVNATAVENNTLLSNTMKQASFTSNIVDLAGNYTTYRLAIPAINSNFYLDNIWNSSDNVQNSRLMATYWQEMGYGNVNSSTIQSTFQFLSPLEFSKTNFESTYKGQALAKSIRSGFSRYGKYQTIPAGGPDNPTLIITPQTSTTEYANYLGELYIKGSGDDQEISYNDAQQGALGDCYLMAAMAAVALRRPSVIKSLISKNADNSYSIEFKSSGSMTRSYQIGGDLAAGRQPLTYVNADLPTIMEFGTPLAYGYSTDRNASGQRELWSSILEKAYAVRYGGMSYKGIETSNSGLALMYLTGSHITEYDLDGVIPPLGSWSENDILKKIKESITNGQPTTISTKSKTDGGLTANHVYVPIDVDSAAQTVSLYDPNSGNATSFHISILKKSCDYIWVAE